MYSVLLRAGCFVCIILMGIVLRRVGYFKAEDFTVLNKIVLRITLTSVVITNFNGQTFDLTMAMIFVIALIFHAILITLGYLISTGESRGSRAFTMLNIAGCNIGNFALPFVSSFLGPAGIMAVSIFDVGNSCYCLGGSYGIARSVKDGEGFKVVPILKNLVRSVPFMTYLGMTILCLLHITLPAPVIELTSIIGSANAFLAMFMIGIGFNLTGDASQAKKIISILAVRYTIGILAALGAWFFLPLPLELRQALVLLFLAPIGSAIPGFTALLKEDVGLSSAINSISIIISICLLTTALVLVI